MCGGNLFLRHSQNEQKLLVENAKIFSNISRRVSEEEAEIKNHRKLFSGTKNWKWNSVEG